jgi:hypothetical protein
LDVFRIGETKMMELDNVIDHLKLRMDWAIEANHYGSIEVFSEAIRYLQILKKELEKLK